MFISHNIEQPVRVVIENNDYFIDWISQPSSIVAIAAVLISIVGLWLSARHNRKTFKSQEQLNARSVEPELTLRGIHLNEEDKVDVFYSHLEVRNSGLGPARLKSLRFEHKGEGFDRVDVLLAKHHQIFISLMDMKRAKHETDIAGTTLAQNETLLLFTYYFDMQGTEVVLLLDTLTKIEVIIEYTSIFDKPKTLKQKLLNN